MHKALTHSILCLTLCLGLATTKASAAITITDFQITDTGLSLSFIGTLPETGPSASNNMIFLINTDRSLGDVFSQETSTGTNTLTFSGSQTLVFGATGEDHIDDSFFSMFLSPFTPGEIFSGTITAGWNLAILRPENIANLNSLELYWGAGQSGPGSGGIFLAAVSAIPEPSTVALIGAGAAAALVLAVRRRRNKA